jgi:hypothetical protein
MFGFGCYIIWGIVLSIAFNEFNNQNVLKNARNKRTRAIGELFSPLL